MIVKDDRTRERRRIRAIVILPNALTLGNLFFGVWATVAALRGDFALSAWLVFFAGVADVLDGRIARFARTNSPFGTELDSLVDLVSFGVAPGVIIYSLLLTAGDWSWTLSFLYIAAVAMRLARFNVEQGGQAKRHFHGLPSPAAGITLAAYYPFSQTAFFAGHLADWPWTQIVGGGMVVISGLMLSHAIYPAVPRINLRTTDGRVGLAVIVAVTAALIWSPRLVLFPAGIAYVGYGALKAVMLGLLDRLPERDPLEEEFEDVEEEARELEYENIRPRT